MSPSGELHSFDHSKSQKYDFRAVTIIQLFTEFTRCNEIVH